MQCAVQVFVQSTFDLAFRLYFYFYIHDPTMNAGVVNFGNANFVVKVFLWSSFPSYMFTLTYNNAASYRLLYLLLRILSAGRTAERDFAFPNQQLRRKQLQNTKIPLLLRSFCATRHFLLNWSGSKITRHRTQAEFRV